MKRFYLVEDSWFQEHKALFGRLDNALLNLDLHKADQLEQQVVSALEEEGAEYMDFPDQDLTLMRGQAPAKVARSLGQTHLDQAKAQDLASWLLNQERCPTAIRQGLSELTGRCMVVLEH